MKGPADDAAEMVPGSILAAINIASEKYHAILEAVK